MMGKFLLFEKNTAIKSYSVRGLNILKELKRLFEDVHKFMKKTTYVKYISNISNKFTILMPASVLGN